MKEKLSKLEDGFILFLYVFGLVLPIIHSSCIFLLLILPIRLIFIKNAISDVKHFILTKYIFNLMLIYTFLVVLIIITTTINFAFDFSLIKTLVNAILHIIVAVMITVIFIKKDRTLKYILGILITIFCIQSVIQISAFFNHDILKFVQLFQTKATIERADIFSGRRGLALSGTVFFGLSTIYGLIFFVYFRKIILLKKTRLIDIIIFCLLFVGGFFTGRTFFIGIGISLFYFITSSISSRLKIRYFIKLIIYVSAIVLILLGLIPQSLYNQINNLFLYVFEAVYNYINTGHATTTSSSHLLDDMYFPISFKTFFIGDGRYITSSGAYYMSTDAGYMRNILLFGIGGLLLTIFFDYKLLWGSKYLCQKYISKLSLYIFIYMLIIHIKGEVFGYLITLHTILFIIYFYIVLSKYKEIQ